MNNHWNWLLEEEWVEALCNAYEAGEISAPDAVLGLMLARVMEWHIWEGEPGLPTSQPPGIYGGVEEEAKRLKVDIVGYLRARQSLVESGYVTPLKDWYLAASIPGGAVGSRLV